MVNGNWRYCIRTKWLCIHCIWPKDLQNMVCLLNNFAMRNPHQFLTTHSFFCLARHSVQIEFMFRTQTQSCSIFAVPWQFWWLQKSRILLYHTHEWHVDISGTGWHCLWNRIGWRTAHSVQNRFQCTDGYIFDGFIILRFGMLSIPGSRSGCWCNGQCAKISAARLDGVHRWNGIGHTNSADFRVSINTLNEHPNNSCNIRAPFFFIFPRDFSGRNENIILVLCENLLYGISDMSNIKFIKRLDYVPLCFCSFVAGWYYGMNTIIVICYISNCDRI